MKKAVALKYPQNAIAPIIVAKGDGLIAEKIIDEAEKNAIPVTENAALVDLMELQEIGDIVPESAWQALAAIFAFILEDK